MCAQSITRKPRRPVGVSQHEHDLVHAIRRLEPGRAACGHAARDLPYHVRELVRHYAAGVPTTRSGLSEPVWATPARRAVQTWRTSTPARMRLVPLLEQLLQAAPAETAPPAAPEAAPKVAVRRDYKQQALFGVDMAVRS